uniref:protein-ribulosamine 3-kinase n=1 Tax=Taeniopygia guttata TaxID=59729 RepID=H0Z8T5_TAEGU
MEDALQEALGTKVLQPTGHMGGGCISHGQSYDTDHGRVFVKCNSQLEARRMFEGEMASLEAILKTETIKVPKPIKVIDLPECSTVFVMEHLEMRAVNRHSAQLGTQLADLHLYNQRLGEKLKKEGSTVGKGQGQTEVQFVDQFGFHTVTCCGYLPQVNDWHSDWVSFFTRQRIQPQMDMIEKKSGDREARELWAQLQLKIPSLFCDMEIFPALLHGDLWGGNVAEDDSGPIIFDPASFYGHSELAVLLLCNLPVPLMQCKLQPAVLSRNTKQSPSQNHRKNEVYWFPEKQLVCIDEIAPLFKRKDTQRNQRKFFHLKHRDKKQKDRSPK